VESEMTPPVVTTTNGKITGRQMFKVKGDPNPWQHTVKEAISVHHRTKTWWEIYHKKGVKL
jgi:hypothetical protein